MKLMLRVLVGALMVLTLAAGSVFAGGSSGGGGDNGQKRGNWHKDGTYTCTDGYTLNSYAWGSAYDLNLNGAVCEKWVDSDTFTVDDLNHG